MRVNIKTYFFNFCRQLFKIKWLENLLVNFTIDKDPLSPVSKMVPNFYQYKSGTLRKVKRNGLKYVLDLSNFYDWYVYYGFADDWIENIISFISPGDVVVDIGVNNGKSLLRIAKAVGKTGRVYGFEPSEENFYKANRNVSTNGFKNIIFHKIALGHRNEKVTLIRYNPGNHGPHPGSSKKGEDKLNEADTQELDAILADKDHEDISLLHIDVEGNETVVIKGALSTIRRYYPVIFLKINNEKLNGSNSSGKELVDLLLSLNYRIFDADTELEISTDEILAYEEAPVYCLPEN